jgi:hypothetical protein
MNKEAGVGGFHRAAREKESVRKRTTGFECECLRMCVCARARVRVRVRVRVCVRCVCVLYEIVRTRNDK